MNNGLNPKRNASAPEVPQPKKKRGTASPRRKQGVQEASKTKSKTDRANKKAEVIALMKHAKRSTLARSCPLSGRRTPLAASLCLDVHVGDDSFFNNLSFVTCA